MTASLASLVDALLDRAALAAPVVAAQIEAARELLRVDLTVVVTGRRGTGKTRLIDALFGGEIGVRDLAAGDRPVEVFTSRQGAAVEWATTTTVTAPYLQHRRVVELPDLPAVARSVVLLQVAELQPDVIVHVAHQRLRTDELDLLDRATQVWRLRPVDVVVALIDPAAG